MSRTFPLALQEQKDPRLWQYFVFNPELIGAEMIPTAWEGIYGFKIRRNPRDASLQPVFNNFPEKDEFLTGDLFQAHESLPNNFKYYGRGDDVIVFSNGEKLNPVTIEDIVVAHPALKHVLVVGQQKFQPAIILDPKNPVKSDAEAEALINDVWPLIEQANKQTVAHGRIVRQLVAISDPHLPFLLAGKGTVQRTQTVHLYKDYIDSIYLRADASVNNVNLDLSSQQALASSIEELLRDKLDIEQLEQSTDFFSHGVDSLQVISLGKMLQAGLEKSGIEFDPNIVATRSIYSNPSVELLSTYIFRAISKSDGESGESAEAEFSAQQIKAMENIVAKYTSNLPERNDAQRDPNETGQTVILTGSTGSLGSYMLDQLVNSPRVSKVYALNRGADGGRSRQEDINTSRTLTKDFSKVEFLGSDLSKPNFGLDAAKYAEMLSSVDRIVHNAWPVNFNMPITSFEPFIRGVRHFVDFAGASPKKVAVVFVSSIGTANNWKSSEPVPERRLEDPNLAEMGYGLSKLAGSFILDAAAAQSGLATISVRVGQIAGPHKGKGVWNPQEFMPSLIASSVHLGVLPGSLGPFGNVDWVPTEDVSGIILDVAGITNSAPIADINGYSHVQNPTRVQWSEVAEFLKEFYGGRIRELSSLSEWVALLEASASDEQNLDKNPAVKLLDTYRGFREKEQAGEAPVVFDMKRTISKSTTAAALKPIDTELLRKWCTAWNF
jgi:thioester reductase-like protein